MAWLRRSFMTGFFVTVPLIISVAALVWIFQVVDGVTEPVSVRILGGAVPGTRRADHGGDHLLAVGAVATNVIGKRVLQRAEYYLLHVPVFKTIYAPVKQLVAAFSPDNEPGSRRSCRRGPRRGMLLGFLTKEFTSIAARARRRWWRSTCRPITCIWVTWSSYPREQACFPDLTVEEGSGSF